MYKSSRKWLCWVYLVAKKKKKKKKSLQKIIENSNENMFFEKWPQVTLLDVEWVELSSVEMINSFKVRNDLKLV